MLMHEKDQRPCLQLVTSQPLRRLFRNQFAHFTVIFLPSLPQVMQQDRQVQEVLPLHLLTDLPDHTRLMGKRFCLSYRQQRMFIYRVLVVQIELHQATERRKNRDDLLQHMHAMHRLERTGHRSRSSEDLQKYPADFRGPEGVTRHTVHVTMDVVQEVGINFEAVGPGQLEQLEEQVRTIQHSSPQLGRNGHLLAGNQKTAVHHGSRFGTNRSLVHSLSQTTVHKPE